MSEAASSRLLVLMPLRDDWQSAAELIKRVDRALSSTCHLDILIVDDGSIQRCPADEFKAHFFVIRSIRTLRLRRNLGHQRAIAIGLTWVQQNLSCDALIVMDADGEDTAEGVDQLIATYSSLQGTKAVFAERSRRSESLLFKIFYRLYKALHLILTGIAVRVGNFSILPRHYLNSLVVVSELWNHYAAAVLRSKLPYTMIPIPRGNRIAGRSSMNFVSLVSHGLSAISVFGDIVGVRLLIASLMASLLAGLALIVLPIVRFIDLGGIPAVPGWVAYATGTLAIVLMQLITIAASFTFFMLSGRTTLGFVPLRDYAWFVEEVAEVYVRDPANGDSAP